MNISVAMTSYNGSAYLPAQLDSLLHQAKPPCEVIICDDCSGDDSAAVIARFIADHQLKNWHLRVNERRLGYRANFHQAVSLAEGDLIALCDQDDFWHADKLQTIDALFSAHPEIAVLASDFDLIDRDGQQIAVTLPAGTSGGGMIPFAIEPGAFVCLPSLKRDPLFLAGCNRTLGCTMVMNRVIRQDYLSFKCLDIPHDWVIGLIAAASGSLFFINRPLISYRLHGSNTIGLPYGERARAIKAPSEEGRVKIHAEYCAAGRFLADYLKAKGLPSLPDALARYGQTRMRALKEYSLLAWLGLWRHHAIYARLFTPKQRLGDLYVILKGKVTRRQRSH